VRPGEEVALDYSVEAYDPDNGEADGRLYSVHQLFTYGPPNFELDAAVVDVLAPSAHGEYRRMNPVSSEAIVRLRNLGAETLRSVRFVYGLEGGGASEFGWEGELAFLESEVVSLPAPDWTGMTGDSRFVVEVASPNGEEDEHHFNDRMTVRVAAPHVLPAEFVIHVETQGFGRAADNSYTITDRSGSVVASRREFEDDTTYDDRVSLSPGAYTFEFLDSEEDGMIRHWWLRGSAPDSIGENGALRILSADGDTLMDLGYDFAEKRTVSFFVGDPR
jgi:hypothetical protein